MALAAFEAELCRCGFPRSVAWHPDMDGWFEQHTYLCLACSVQKGDDVTYDVAINTRPDDQPLPPFVLDDATTESTSSTTKTRTEVDASVG